MHGAVHGVDAHRVGAVLFGVAEVGFKAFDSGFQLGEAAPRFGDGFGEGGAEEGAFGFEFSPE